MSAFDGVYSERNKALAARTVYVFSKSDFPAPLPAGGIPLEANTAYFIMDNVDLGTDWLIIPSGGNTNLIGASFNNQSITRSGTGDMIRNVGGIEFLRIELLALVNTGSGTFMSPTPFLANPLSQVSILECLVTGFASLGTWTSRPFINDCAFVDNTVGITLNDVIDFRIEDNIWSNSSDLGTTYITIGDEGVTSGAINRNTITSLAGETGLNIVNTIAAGSLLRVDTNSFRGAGPALDPAGLDQKDIRVQASGNDGVPDSQIVGEVYLNTLQLVTIATQSVPVLIDGVNWVLGTLERVTGTTAGRLTYIGIDPITLHVSGQATLDKVMGGSDLLELHIFKNGSAIAQPSFGTQSNAPAFVSVTASLPMVTNDFIELYASNESGTGNLNVLKALIEIE